VEGEFHGGHPARLSVRYIAENTELANEAEKIIGFIESELAL
jgi:hypothetical protein